MAFKIPKAGEIIHDDPVALFNDLRQRKVQGLLAHQADVLRAYMSDALNAPDVALQLPTGSGKTLVGLLIAEWRRRNYRERAVYLCPTRQLVNQVVEQAQKKYGIRALAFIGPQADYAPKASSEYANSEAIAVTAYTSLFNVKPFFNDAQLILLDDAHSAEQYIGGMWSLRIERKDYESVFIAAAGCLQAALSLADRQRLVGKASHPSDRSWVEKIPTPTFLELVPELIPILDRHTANTNLYYAWSQIRGRLQACHLYISPVELLIRPILPPTNEHQSFAAAKQRVYMSATLGEGGELERLSGRRNIKRLEVPTGWDKQGIGRRLFLFPERSLTTNAVEVLSLHLMQSAGRTLVLVPDDARANKVRAAVHQNLGFATFNAKDIENSKEPFISRDHAVAVVSNRYDGIDFLEDECRLLIITGLPRATNLQERFLIERMGAVALLNDRILTRLVQAFGRCTRSPTDYAAVVICGEELTKYLMGADRRGFLHPELQAELAFGIEQSKDSNASDVQENFKLFFEQGEEWQEADGAIVAMRQSLAQQKLPATGDLRRAVTHELEYQYALWRSDYEGALESCRAVLGELNDPSLRGYRAMWLYLAGSSAWQAHKAGIAKYDAVANEYYRRAMSATMGITWLAKLARMKEAPMPEQKDDGTMALVERLEGVFDSLGTLHDHDYALEEKSIIEGLLASDHVKFEDAHARLGRILGFDSGNVETTGAPDPWWIANEKLCFVFEDHSEASPDSSLSIDKARQVSTHENWVRAQLPVDKETIVRAVLITPVRKADDDALIHLRAVSVWRLEEFRQWATAALSVIRRIRRSYLGTGDLAWRADAAAALSENGISPEKLADFLSERTAEKMLTRARAQ
jgi:hypothetical protein